MIKPEQTQNEPECPGQCPEHEQRTHDAREPREPRQQETTRKEKVELNRIYQAGAESLFLFGAVPEGVFLSQLLLPLPLSFFSSFLSAPQPLSLTPRTSV